MSWLVTAFISSVLLVFFLMGAAMLVRSATWGLPKWFPQLERPLECPKCGRRFQYVNPEELTECLALLGPTALLILHERAEHDHVPGAFTTKLPVRARPDISQLRHKVGSELMTEQQWLERLSKKSNIIILANHRKKAANT